MVIELTEVQAPECVSRPDNQQRGQVVIEWLGILLLLLVLLVAISTALPGLGSRIVCEVKGQIAAITGGDRGCADAGDERRASDAPPRQTPFGAPDRPRTPGATNQASGRSGARKTAGTGKTRAEKKGFGKSEAKLSATGFGPNAIALRQYGILDRIKQKVERYYELAKALVGEERIVAGGFVCGESKRCASLIRSAKQSKRPEWLIGEIVSLAFAYGDLRDFISAIVHGKLTEAALSALGVVPIGGDTLGIVRAIRKFVKRTNLPLHKVMSAVAKVFGKNNRFTRRILNSLTGGAYSRIRRGGISHEGVEQLARRGNDIKALSRNARLAKETLNRAEVNRVDVNVKRYWSKRGRRARAEAQGIEATLQLLKRNRDIDKILISGRPGKGRPRNGPDIVALKKDGTLLVIEAKGTRSRNRPLTLSKVQSRVGGTVYVQPSREWLAADAGRRYLNNLRRSSSPRDREAARRLRGVIAGTDRFDAGIVNVRPANGKAYGRGIDTTARLIRQGGNNVRRIDIIDVPFR